METRYKNRFYLSVVAAGLVSITTQIILLREFMVVFYGNELVMGIILANWMLLTGLGSFLGRFSGKMRNSPALIVLCLTLQALLPVITVFLLYAMRNTVFPIGKMIGIFEVFYSSLILLLPFCMVTGFLFTLFCTHAFQKYQENLTGRIYGFESTGSIIGGVLFNFILVFYFRTFQSLMVLMVISFVAAFIFSLMFKGWWKYLLVPVAVAAVVIMNVIGLDDMSKKKLYIDQDILYQKDTPYGNIVVTRTGDQVNFYENGITLFTSGNTIENEESVHYAMVQSRHPQNILVLSGGMSGIISEIEKYKVDRIDYVEMNPWIIRIAERYFKRPADSLVRIINRDAKLFIRQTGMKYDVVLINLPEPATAQINRFYTVNFFKSLKTRLNPGAVVSTSLMSTANYMSPEQRRIHSALMNSLHHSFNNVIIIPGGKNYFIASDSTLDIGIAELIKKKGLDNVYVNQYYINDGLLKERSDNILASLDMKGGVNTDFRPVTYLQQSLLWLSYFKMDYRIPLMVIIVLLVMVIFFFSPVNLGMFAGGFSASSLEFLILIAFQVIYGYVYQMTGVIIMTFMAGLALGSLYMNRYLPRNESTNFRRILFGLALFSFLLPLLILVMSSTWLPAVAVHALFIILTLILSGLVGMLFAQASVIQKNNVSRTSSAIYSADLIGSAFGVLIVSAFLLPWLGITQVCFIIGCLNILSWIMLLVRKGRILNL
jgi:spermidine synthase